MPMQAVRAAGEAGLTVAAQLGISYHVIRKSAGRRDRMVEAGAGAGAGVTGDAGDAGAGAEEDVGTAVGAGAGAGAGGRGSGDGCAGHRIA